MFLVIGDNQETAIELVTKSQEDTSDIHFAGTINFGLEGQLTKEESSGIDFATLTLCDHVIVTHGTFGLWAAFLASDTNTHIMAKRNMLEEVKEVMKAGLKNFIFMDDLWVNLQAMNEKITSSNVLQEIVHQECQAHLS